jgi:hypothetical protein
MQRRRIILEGLAETDRIPFVSAFVKRYVRALSFQFPPELGYQLAREPASDAWNITRGRFWGLLVRVVSKDAALTWVDVTIEGYFPAVRRIVEPMQHLNRRWDNLSGLPRWLMSHFLVPLLLIPVMALLPFLALYRLATLSLTSDILAATRQLDSLWPEFQAFCPGAASLSRPRSRVLTYSLAVMGLVLAAVGCFWWTGLAGIDENWKTALYVAGVILALVSVGFLVALIMTLLGFEMER